MAWGWVENARAEKVARDLAREFQWLLEGAAGAATLGESGSSVRRKGLSYESVGAEGD